MGATTDWTVTPRPIYYADGKKAPDCYTRPPELHDELVAELGEFPLFQYWGPDRVHQVLGVDRRCRAAPDAPGRPHARLPPAPRLRPPAVRTRRAGGPAGRPRRRRGARTAARRRSEARCARRGAVRVRHHRGRHPRRHQPGAAVRGPARGLHAGRHGIPRPVDVAGLRRRRPPGRARLRRRPGRPGAGAVAVRRPARGRPRCSTRPARPRSGSTTSVPASSSLVADPTAWFTYYYWLDDDRAPDFARGVEIHRKPGYDPAELFFDPEDQLVKAKAALTLARKAAGLRYAMKVVPLDPSPVRGTHGRLPGPRPGRTGAAVRSPRRRRRTGRRHGRAGPAARAGGCAGRLSRRGAGALMDVDTLLERVRERLRTPPSCGVAEVDRLVADALRPGKLLRPDLVVRSAAAARSRPRRRLRR